MGHRQPVHTGLPSRLADLRENVKKWNKSEAARRCNLSPSLYGRYEAGIVEPTLSNILKLREGFRVDFETLIGEKMVDLSPAEEEKGKPA